MTRSQFQDKEKKGTASQLHFAWFSERVKEHMKTLEKMGSS